MNAILCTLLAVLSLWDYPSRQATHERLRAEFTRALRAGEIRTMESVCRQGTELLPDDPTWAYNLACALAYRESPDAALEQLEKAIDLGFRDPEAIAGDADFRRIAKDRRFKELVEMARQTKDRPLLIGPLAGAVMTGVAGETAVMTARNFEWDFDLGCFSARLALAPGPGGNAGDLYLNRDDRHSHLVVTNFPGLTEVRLDQEGRQRRMDVDFPNMRFPYPVFGNCSRAYTHDVYWRSLPRAMMTTQTDRLRTAAAFYLDNQTWVYPANADFPPVGTNGDCFVSVAPYWLVTQGRSWSDQYYLRAALEASRSFNPTVKREIVARRLLAPTIQTLIRKSLKGVADEAAYMTEKAHPTCLPPDGLDLARLKRLAGELRAEAVPPVAPIRIAAERVDNPSSWPECLYVTPLACAFVLRAPVDRRVFVLHADGGDEYAFRCVHGDSSAVKLVPQSVPNEVRIEISSDRIKGSRVDIAVFARTKTSGWGAPSYVSFSVPDPGAVYSDPALRPQMNVQ